MKRLFALFFLLLLFKASFANYHATEINFEYNKTEKRVYLEVRYWRLCNTSQDPLFSNLRINMPGCGSFTVPIDQTTITDVSLHKERYPAQACINQNSNNNVNGVEEFKGFASFATDTIPFKNAASNGCCKIYISIDGIFIRPQGITTGVTGQLYNFAMMDVCNILGSNESIYRSPRFVQAHHTEQLQCNQGHFIDHGLDQTDSDSIYCAMGPALGSSRTQHILPSSPLTYQSPISSYCPPGFNFPCDPIPQANPAIGFYINPETGRLTFTPTHCKQTGVAVIETLGFLKDSNGVNKLTSSIRRDFVLNITSKVNNIPTIVGPSNYYVNEGDTLNAQLITKDPIVVYPPPIPNYKRDTTFFKIESHPSLSITVADSLVRERKLNLNLIADSTTSSNKNPITASVIVMDQDSLYPARNSYSYRVYIREKLNLSLQVTALSCGYIKVKISGDSLNLKRFHSANKKVELRFANQTQNFNLSNDSIILKLDTNGLHHITIQDIENQNWGISLYDSIQYNLPMIRVRGNEGYKSICGDEDSSHIGLNIFNNTGDSASYKWYKNNSLYSNAKILKTDSTANFTYRVSAGTCADSGFIYIQKRQPLVGRFSEITLCRESCDSIHLLNFTTAHSSIIRNFSASISHTNKSGLASTYKWLPCATNTSDYPQGPDSLILRYSTLNNRCFIYDTLVIKYSPKLLHFKDSSFCFRNDTIHLSALTQNDPFMWNNNISFVTLNNDTPQNNIIFNDNSGQLNNYYIKAQNTEGDYTINYSYRANSCNFTDSFKVKLKSSPGLSLLKSEATLCEESADYPFTHFIQDTGLKFTVLKKNGQAFTGAQSQLIANNTFIGTSSIGQYELSLLKTYSNGCNRDSSIQINIVSNPTFSLGQDIDVNNFDNIILGAPMGYASYQWNINNNQNRLLQGSAKQLGLDSGNNQIICTITDRNGCSSSDTVLIQYRTSIKRLVNSGIKVYPNPSDGEINIESNKRINKIELISSIGQKVWEQKMENPKEQTLISIGQVTPGNYIMLIYTEEGISYWRQELK